MDYYYLITDETGFPIIGYKRKYQAVHWLLSRQGHLYPVRVFRLGGPNGVHEYDDLDVFTEPG